MIDIRKWLFGDRAAAFEHREKDEALARLAPFAARIKATELPIVAARIGTHPPLSPAGSQLGGHAWWPKDRPYPLSRERAPLFLLAQINLAEMPGLVPFPPKGLLQFFIGDDDLYGCDFEQPGAAPGFACVYHDTTDSVQPQDLRYLRLDERQGCSPLETPLAARALTFVTASMTIDCGDYRFAKLFPEIDGDDSLREAYFESRDVPALRLGGYPTFTQTDPRCYGDPSRYGDFTLATFDTSDGIMWGDSGVAQFFMHEPDLKRRDFSRVAYNWDCC